MSALPLRRHSATDAAAGDRLAPVRLPFTIESIVSGGAAAPVREGRSWASRLGLWWADAEEGGPGVVVTGLAQGSRLAGVLAVGDVITAVDGSPVGSLGDLTRLLDRLGGGVAQASVRGADGGDRLAALRVPAPEGQAAAAGGQPASVTARVPVTDLLESLSAHIQLILSNPVQREVTHPGVSAHPEFGCLGADLEFSLQNVGLSEIRNAIVNCEPRLTDVEVDTVELEVREEGQSQARAGVRVSGKLKGTGQVVRIDLEIDGLGRRRRSNLRRVDSGDAGLEQR